jgi:hypothetical protein
LAESDDPPQLIEGKWALDALKRRFKASYAESRAVLEQTARSFERNANLIERRAKWPEGADMFRKLAAESRQQIQEIERLERELDGLTPSDFVAPAPRVKR